MRRGLKITIIMLLIAFITLGFFSIQVYRNLFAPLPIKQLTIVIVEPQTPAIKLAWQLYRGGLIRNPDYFIWMARLQHDLTRIKSGEYKITPRMSARDLLRKMVAGDVVMYKFRIIEGWTFNQVLDAISRQPTLMHTLNGVDPKKIPILLGCDKNHPEGLFYPDTYLFARGTSDRTILRNAYEAMENKLNQAWQNRTTKLPYKDPYEALIVASMIEKESAVHDERPKIARVVLNRLQKNMLLQIDPTVIYGLGDKYTGKIMRADLMLNTPYNTYLNKGLPPTPICMPGLSAINAALNPAATNALYYVARGDGSHIFSDSLRDHDVAIFKYLIPKEREIQRLTSKGRTSTNKDLLINFWYMIANIKKTHHSYLQRIDLGNFI